MKYVVEKRYGGFPAFIHKCGSDVKISSADGKDITNNFPSIASQAESMSDDDFLLEGEIVDYSEAEPKGRERIETFLKKDEENKWMTFHVIDLLWHGDGSLEELPWWKRRAELRKMEFPANIQESHPLIADYHEVDEVVEMVRKSPHATGVVVRRYDSENRNRVELINHVQKESDSGSDKEDN